MGSPALDPAPLLWRSLLVTLVAAVAALTAAGAVVATGLGGEHEEDRRAAAGRAPFRLGEDVPTSFGVVAVEAAQKLVPPSASDVGGMTHGMAGRVPRGKARVETFVTLTNSRRRAIDYSPAQFSLVAGGRPIGIRRTSARPGSLQPDASIDIRLVFHAPRTDGPLRMRFSDRGRPRPIEIDLGRVGTAPKAGLAGGRARPPGPAPDGHGDHR